MPRQTPFRIAETDDLDGTTGSGAMNVHPDDGEVTIAEYEAQEGNRLSLIALGATDHEYTDYILYVDNDQRFSTRSPLGLTNQPFSLYKDLGVAYPADRLIQLKVKVLSDVLQDNNSADTKSFAARLFVNETSPSGDAR